jgi:Domain of unknown function (DUF6429)
MNKNKIDEAVLALLYLGSHVDRPNGPRWTWKSFDWDAMERLYKKGLISNPLNKAKSVSFTGEGLAQAKHAFERLFGEDDPR